MTRRTRKNHRSIGAPNPGSQRGVVLFVALVVLVAMTLAGLALLRQMGAGTSIAGNVAFKENATSVADRGIEVARAWLLANAANLNIDNPAAGYYSSWNTNVDPTTYDWRIQASGDADPSGIEAASTGNQTRFIIRRLCQTPGISPSAAGQVCSDGVRPSEGGTMESGTYASSKFAPLPTPFYQVTARVKGPRNTYSYVQVVMN